MDYGAYLASFKWCLVSQIVVISQICAPRVPVIPLLSRIELTPASL